MTERIEMQSIIRRKTVGLAFVLGAASMAYAQQKVNVQGKIAGPGGEAVPYASVTFSNKANKLYSDAALTDDSGNYTLQLVPGSYDIIVEAIDFKKYTVTRQVGGGNLGTLQIAAEEAKTGTQTKNIEGVTITAAAAKPYRVEIDKKVYDPSQDIISKGGNLQDVLANVPSVSVDTDGTVSMRGNTNVRFLINGKPSALLGIDDGANALQSIPADQIERIEVISNPSSKFEAAGTAGILNIILKKNNRMGFNGSVTGSLGYQPQTSLNANLSWRKGPLTWFLNGGGAYREMVGKRENDSWYRNAGVNRIVESHQTGESKNKMETYNATGGIVYDLSERTSLNASGSMRTFDSDGRDENIYLNLYNGISDEHKTRNSVGRGTNLAWQGDFGFDHKFDDKGQNVAVSLSLQRNRSRNSTDYLQLSDVNYVALGKTFQDFNMIDRDRTYSLNKSIVGKIDYELPIGENSKLEAGYRLDRNNNLYDNYGDSSTNTDLVNPVFEVNRSFTAVTNYKELFNAFYAQFKSKVGNFGYQLGLRDEISKVDVDFRNLETTAAPIRKSYNDLFPSVFLSYDFDKNNQLLLNYSRRIDRPRSFFLVPFSSRNDSQNRFSGNPDLNPSYINSFELGYNLSRKKFSLNPTLYFRDEQDNVQMIQELDPETQAFAIRPINIGSQKRYGLDMNFTLDALSWLKLMGNVDLFGYKTVDSYYNADNNFNGDGFSTRARLTSTFRVDKTFSMQLQGFYRGGQKTATQETKPMYAVSFGANKTIWKGDGTIAFNIQDIFNTRSREVNQYGANYTRHSYMQWMPRQAAISLTYRFRQGEKVEQPRRRKDINANEQGGDDQGPM